ncbi:MAG: hypothetical protein OEN02_03190 [Gammaproteobacteria bacterium]|nr:hypothetical protein [Gammaproteobacteria bacterium]
MQKLTNTDIKNAIIFLNRVDLKGNESMPHAELMMKLQSELNDREMTAPVTDSGEQPPTPTPIDLGKKEA